MSRMLIRLIGNLKSLFLICTTGIPLKLRRNTGGEEAWMLVGKERDNSKE